MAISPCSPGSSSSPVSGSTIFSSMPSEGPPGGLDAQLERVVEVAQRDQAPCLGGAVDRDLRDVGRDLGDRRQQLGVAVDGDQPQLREVDLLEVGLVEDGGPQPVDGREGDRAALVLQQHQRVLGVEVLHADERRADREAAVERLQRAQPGERQRVELAVLLGHREALLPEHPRGAHEAFVGQAAARRAVGRAWRGVDDHRGLAGAHAPLHAGGPRRPGRRSRAP